MKISLFLFSIYLSGSVWSQTTGRELLAACSETVAMINNTALGTDRTQKCISYVIGYTNALDAMQTLNQDRRIICTPPNVTIEQAVRVLEKSLRDRPEALHESTALLATTAFMRAFPCKQ